jgi:hypothetical protein
MEAVEGALPKFFGKKQDGDKMILSLKGLVEVVRQKENAKNPN